MNRKGIADASLLVDRGWPIFDLLCSAVSQGIFSSNRKSEVGSRATCQLLQGGVSRGYRRVCAVR